MEKDKKNIEQNIWHGIEKKLGEPVQEKNTAALTQAINQLPQYEPGKNVWLRIESELSNLSSRKRKISFGNIAFWRTAAAAACLLLGIGYWYIAFNNQSSQVELAYSTEVEQEPNTTAELGIDTTLNSYFKEQCEQAPDKCSNPQFVQLQEQQSLLQAERIELEFQLNENPGNENIIACIARIDNQQIQIQKQMLKYLIS